MSHFINLSVSSNTDKQHVLFTETISFFGLCTSPNIYKNTFFGSRFSIRLQVEKHLTLDPLDRAICSHWVL